MKRLLNFSFSALTRSEMKNVKGGEDSFNFTCPCFGGGQSFSGYMTASDTAVYGHYYCPAPSYYHCSKNGS